MGPGLAATCMCVPSCDGDSGGPAPSRAASVTFHIHGVLFCDCACMPEGACGGYRVWALGRGWQQAASRWEEGPGAQATGQGCVGDGT